MFRFPRVPARLLLIAPVAMMATASLSSAAGPAPLDRPLRFFDGRTEMVSVVKVVMKKPYRSRTVGRGDILPDGSLKLVQQVHEEGKSSKQRRWNIRKVASGQFAGTMSEAVGPVRVEEIDGKYRFRFRMKGNLAVEQWVSPLPGGEAARSRATVRKFGMRVATSEGTIRRL